MHYNLLLFKPVQFDGFKSDYSIAPKSLKIDVSLCEFIFLFVRVTFTRLLVSSCYDLTTFSIHSTGLKFLVLQVSAFPIIFGDIV